MLKEAKSPPDAVQQKLRQNKKSWNGTVSAFIDNLIHYKKLMNGTPNKFYAQKGDIKHPIPADPATIIGSLANDFSEIAQNAAKITNEQIEFSRNRRKRQSQNMKQTNLPFGEPSTPSTTAPAPTTSTPATPNLSQQLSMPLAANAQYKLIKVASSFEDKYGLEKEASNPVTRFFTRLFNPTVGIGQAADIRRARIAMLDAALDTYRNLGKFQVQVVKKSKDSIIESYKKLNEANSKWTLVSRSFAIFQKSKSVGTPNTGGTIVSQISEQDKKEEKALEMLGGAISNIEKLNNPDVITSTIEKNEEKVPDASNQLPPGADLTNFVRDEVIKNIVSDYTKYSILLPPNVKIHAQLISNLSSLGNMVDKYIATRGKIINPEMENLYRITISDVNRVLGTKGPSFKDIVIELRGLAKAWVNPKKIKPVIPTVPVTPEAQPIEMPKAASTQLEKVAQDFLKKWIGKTIHQFSLADPTSTHRLNCYKLAGELRVELNGIMNLLEKDLDADQLDPVISDANSKMIQLRGMMRSLHLSMPKNNKAPPPPPPM